MSTSTSATDSLFQPLQLGSLDIPNRVIMAPLTRCRAIDHMPNELMREYYTQRASGGLIITECTMVTPQTSAFASEPGIYSDEQVSEWKKITDSVHAAGGRIFMQIWHAGRAVHPELNDGKPAVSASPIAIEGGSTTPQGQFEYQKPEALTEEQIQELVNDFRKGAENAKKAGFDGVEVHGANGYLLDQFLRDGANNRDDNYGGSWHNQVRFLTEVLDAVCEVFTPHRVGVRFSPLNSFNDMKDSDPVALVKYLAAHLNPKDLAYVHLMRADFLGEQKADVVTPFRELYNGQLILNMGYSPEEAADTVESRHADAIAFGTAFLANPDLPERIRQGEELNEPDPNTFYTQDAKGYTDYPTLETAEA